MSPIRMSEIESAMRLVLKFYTAFNKHDVSELTKLISDDCRMEAAVVEAGETELSGSQAIIQSHIIIEDAISVCGRRFVTAELQK